MNSTSPAITASQSVPRHSLGNSSCPPCAIQPFGYFDLTDPWLTIGVMLDTIIKYIEPHSGTDAKAITRTSTVFDSLDTDSLDPSATPTSLVVNAEDFDRLWPGFGVVNGTDNDLTALSLTVATLFYASATPFPGCPPHLQQVSNHCQCAFTVNKKDTPLYLYGSEAQGMTTEIVTLPDTFYNQLSLSIGDGGTGSWGAVGIPDMAIFSSWLVGQPWASTLFPNPSRCTFVTEPEFRPTEHLFNNLVPTYGISVSALTATITSTLPSENQLKPSAGPVSTSTHFTPSATATATPGHHLHASLSSSARTDKAPAPIFSNIVPPAPTPSENNGDIETTSVDDDEKQTSRTTQAANHFWLTSQLQEHHSQATALPIMTVGDQILKSLPTGHAVEVGSITLAEGSPAVTLSGTPISYDQSGLVIGTSTIPLLNEFHSEAALTAAGITFTPVPNGLAVVGAMIQQDGPAIETSATPISYGPSGLITAASTIQLPTPAASVPVFTAAGLTFNSASNGLLVAGSTLELGGKGIAVSGTKVSYGLSGLVVGTSTVSLPAIHHSSTSFVLGGYTFNANPTTIAVSGATLTKGGHASVISGTPFSLGPAGLVIGSSTYRLPYALPSSFLTTDSMAFTVVTTGIEVAGKGLSKGELAVTMNGTAVSLGPSGLVVGSSIIGVVGGSQSTAQGIGAVIMAGFGTSMASATPTPRPSIERNATTAIVSFRGFAAKQVKAQWSHTAVAIFFVWITFSVI